MIITDFKWFRKNGEEQTGYYMDKYLVSNLIGIPKYLSKSWDVVGIVSGHGKVRVGKSTMAQQVGYFLAWLIAGGQIEFDEKVEKVINVVNPKTEVHFNLEENMVFSPQDLQKSSESLFKKYGKNQVIVYDEARGGLASDRAMESINKTMSEWFEQCGQYGHIILLVLPNFFKLHEDYAVARSLFLIDVFADSKHNRGYFNFYNEMQKERLFYFGRKRVGVTAKYGSAHESFWGKFTSFMPLPEKEYSAKKSEAISKLRRTRFEKRFIKQRDVLLYIIKNRFGLTFDEIARAMTLYCGETINIDMIKHGINSIEGGTIDETG